MARKPTGRPNGRPPKAASEINSGLSWELENVPLQSDFHHSLFDIAGAFELGPDWLTSVEVPIRDIFGDNFFTRIKSEKWLPDGSDFYSKIETLIEYTAFDQKVDTGESKLLQDMLARLKLSTDWSEQYKIIFDLARPKSPDTPRKRKKAETQQEYESYLGTKIPRRKMPSESDEDYLLYLKKVAPRPQNNLEKDWEYDEFLLQRASKLKRRKFRSTVKGTKRVVLQQFCKKLQKRRKILTKDELLILNNVINECRKNILEEQFLDSIITNCAKGIIKNRKLNLRNCDLGDVIGRACEKIIVAGTYNPTSPIGEKISYLKGTVSAAAYDIVRQKIGIQRKEKELTVRQKHQEARARVYTIEDVLVDLDYAIGPAARAKKSA